MTKIHFIKTVQPHFEGRQNGLKTFEIRNNDRDYRVGDVLIERLWHEDEEGFVGPHLVSRVEYISSYAQKSGFIVMAVKTLESVEELSHVLIEINNQDERREG